MLEGNKYRKSDKIELAKGNQDCWGTWVAGELKQGG